jgi:hypothetical protein
MRSELDICFLTCLKALTDSIPKASLSSELSLGVENVTLFFIVARRTLVSPVVLMTGFSDAGPLFRLVSLPLSSSSKGRG